MTASSGMEDRKGGDEKGGGNGRAKKEAINEEIKKGGGRSGWRRQHRWHVYGCDTEAASPVGGGGVQEGARLIRVFLER